MFKDDLKKKKTQPDELPIQAKASVPSQQVTAVQSNEVAGQSAPDLGLNNRTEPSNPVSASLNVENAAGNIPKEDKMITGETKPISLDLRSDAIEQGDAALRRENIQKTQADKIKQFHDAILKKNKDAEEIEKEERRKAIRSGWTGVSQGLSALSNLFFTTKWAPNQPQKDNLTPIMQEIKEDRLRRNAELQRYRDYLRSKGDKDEERAFQVNFYNHKQAAQQKAAEQKSQIQYLHDLGLIDARAAADLEKSAAKGEADKKLAEIKHKYRIGEITLQGEQNRRTKLASESSPSDSVVGDDGNVYTRSKRLTDNEGRQLVSGILSPDELKAYTDVNFATGKTSINWDEALAKLISQGKVSADRLINMGFKKSGTSKKKVGGFSENGKKKIEGF